MMVPTMLTRRPRLTYRRLSVIFATVCLLLVSVLCLVLNFSYVSNRIKISRKHYMKLSWKPDGRSAPTRSTLPGPITDIFINHQYKEWLEAIRKKRNLPPTSEFMKQQALVQRERKRALSSVCKRNPKLARPSFTDKNTRQMYALDKNRLFYCAIPKAGCTNWKKVIMVLEGLRHNVWNITGSDAHLRSHLKNLSSMTPSERNDVLYTYPKFIYVRHPYVRLISAYRNKIACDISRQGKTFQGFARKIVTKYRKGAVLAELEAGGNYNVTFDEWVQYLTDPWEMDTFNHHWQEFYKLCLPCKIQYDFIGTLETVGEDSKYMLSTLGLDRVLYPSSATADSSSLFYDQYFANVSQENLQALWEIYKYDFKLFGFEKPSKSTDNPTDYQISEMMT